MSTKSTIRIEDLPETAAAFARSLEPLAGAATVVALEGELGSGKTTFTAVVAAELAVAETVISPTFIIERSYDIGREDSPFSRLIHIDAYRLNGREELEMLDWKSKIADPGNLIFIEWPSNVEGALPDRHIRISFEHVGEGERNIQIDDRRKEEE